MRFFDAHCDTIQAILEHGADFETGLWTHPQRASDAAGYDSASPGAAVTGAAATHRLHITLPAMRTAGVCCQVFAAWAWRKKYGDRAAEAALEMTRATVALCSAYPDDLLLARSGTDVEEAFAESPGAAAAGRNARIAVIPGLEGGDALDGLPERIEFFHGAGVRILTLAWADTPFCGSTYGSGTGLTPAGRELVERCETLGVMVDVSHASDRAFDEVAALAQRPFVASHSGCRAVCPNPRNLTDDMICALAQAGGVMGIPLGSAFLSPETYLREKPGMDAFFRSMEAGEASFEEAWAASEKDEATGLRPPLSWVVDHVKHAIQIGGEDCVGLGGDMDGVSSTPEGLDGVADYPRIAELLLEGGLTNAQVEKVCWRNMSRVFAGIS
jgi:membrane dipeptidase